MTFMALAVFAAFIVGGLVGMAAEAKLSRDAQEIAQADAVARAVAREQAILRDVRSEHLREIERLMALHRDELTRLGNMAQFQRPDVPPAEKLTPAPDAERRILTHISETAIERGAERLVEEYRAVGLTLSIEEARIQANAMLHGEPLPTGLT